MSLLHNNDEFEEKKRDVKDLYFITSILLFCSISIDIGTLILCFSYKFVFILLIGLCFLTLVLLRWWLYYKKWSYVVDRFNKAEDEFEKMIIRKNKKNREDFFKKID